jgi:PilZ domain-containing protein
LIGQTGSMTNDDLETIALRPTVVDGVRRDDDFEVLWRGLPIGRILKQPDNAHWWWGCNLYGQPATPGDRGPAINFKDCQVRFKLAWARIRPTLTDEAIAAATRHAETLQPPSGAAGQAAPESLQVLENNRAALRQRVLKSASIEFHGGVIDCVVRNISETGAALEVASPLGIPETFNLVISGDHTSRPCQVAWRKDKRIGVAFT